MGDILQHKIGVKIEYVVGQGEMKIDLEGSDDNYYAKLDEIMVNPLIVDLHNLDLKKNGIKMDFNAPLICNLDNFDSSKSLMGGVKFEGEEYLPYLINPSYNIFISF